MAMNTPRSTPVLRRVRLFLEPLESRLVLSGGQPTAMEQLMLEQLNDIRANPVAYGTAIGLPAIENVAPAPPLAFNTSLITAAEGHSQDMNANNYFSHIDLQGNDPGARMLAAGFNWTDYGESIAAGYDNTADALQGLIVDTGVPDLGHRMHLLAMNNSDESVGIGVVQNGTGSYGSYYTIDTGNTSDNRAFLCGVVFNNLNGTGKYAIGEGLSGVTISVAGAGSVVDYNTGGYSIPLNPGTYTVTASGGQLATPITQTVTIGSTNVRLNFTPGVAPPTPLPTNLAAIATQITHSTESYRDFVTTAYQTYLKRTPDAAGLAYWANQMAQGVTNEQIEASFIGSAEYIADHGGQSAAWVSGMYQDLLGRAAAPNEITNWMKAMSQGITTTQVAYGFAASAESEGKRVTATYETVLGRAPTQNEITYWVNSFLQGTTDEAVTAGFLASQEFYNNMAGGNSGNWLQVVFQDVFQRNPTQTEVAYWEGQMTT